MDRRYAKRTAVKLEASIVVDGNSFDGFIDNISEGGVGYLIKSSLLDPKNFVPKKMIEIRFEIPPGDTVHLNCEVMWFARASSELQPLSLGVRIIDPPKAYTDWLKTLTGSSVITKL